MELMVSQCLLDAAGMEQMTVMRSHVPLTSHAQQTLMTAESTNDPSACNQNAQYVRQYILQTLTRHT